MAQMPRDDAFDSTSALLSEGYRFIPERCRRLRSDVFEARLMLRRVVCMSGEEAAGQFYEPGRFTRRGGDAPIDAEAAAGRRQRGRPGRRSPPVAKADVNVAEAIGRANG